MKTPGLVAFDDSLALLPVPYRVYKRVHGETLELLGLDSTSTPSVYPELARLHSRIATDGPAGQLRAHLAQSKELVSGLFDSSVVSYVTNLPANGEDTSERR